MHQITTARTNSLRDGDCSACTDHVTPDGASYHQVFRVTLRGFELRLCKGCAAELITQLGGTNPTKVS